MGKKIYFNYLLIFCPVCGIFKSNSLTVMQKNIGLFFSESWKFEAFFSGYYENIYVTIKQDRTSCLYTGPALFTCFSFFRLWTFPLLFFYDGKFLPITITCRNFHMMIGHYVWIFPPIWPPLPQRKTRKCSNMLFCLKSIFLSSITYMWMEVVAMVTKKEIR